KTGWRIILSSLAALAFTLQTQEVSGQSILETTNPQLPLVVQPPVRTNLDKLKFLIWVHRQMPSLFQDAGQFKIDLFKILEDQSKLLELLAKQPAYKMAFEQRRRLAVLSGGYAQTESIVSKKMNPAAVREWVTARAENFVE